VRPGNVFQLEMAAAVAGRRTLMIRLGFTLLLGLPFILVSMPVKIQASGLSVIIIFIAFFGSAVTFVRRKSEGHMDRLKILPVPGWRIIGDMVLAGAFIDCIQMGLLFFFLFMIYGSFMTYITILKITGLFITTLLLLNLLGILLASITKDNAEVHLFGTLGSGLLAFISGLFPVPDSLEPVVRLATAWNPLSMMGNTLIRASIRPSYAMNDLDVPWMMILFLFILIVGQRFLEGRNHKTLEKKGMSWTH
jgi:ABC-type multidrug transport system permease subunit